ncbi:MAG: hypothetical protein LBQ62_09990 [Candidatus Accumulibacter sp.]|jgi:hypothetical protein|nr:hypothetical protein [Accumulibacter sp.]
MSTFVAFIAGLLIGFSLGAALVAWAFADEIRGAIRDGLTRRLAETSAKGQDETLDANPDEGPA